MEPVLVEEESTLEHLDERLGHVAVDMGYMTPQQVDETKMRVLVANADPNNPSSFGKEATELGYLTPDSLAFVKKEELRRRRLISGYEIIRRIGSGTIATVYHARQLTMDREVALKVLHPRLAKDPVFVRNYIAEAQAVSRFHHPNIVQGFDAGESNGFIYFAHEYLAGGSIADLLARKKGHVNFSENRLLFYLRQTTSALRHAWAVAVYHGDINPGNLLLDGHGDIKLANLGVPRVADLRKAGASMSAPGFIRCGPDYAAPEQLAKPELVNAHTDMYNLGATFYHISFGEPPFKLPEGAPNGESLAEFRKRNPLPSFALESQEGYSGKYLRLLHDMLDVDPERRPANPEELAARLEKFHLSLTDELSGLARQVRISRPEARSARASQRLSRPEKPPNSHFTDRLITLARRPETMKSDPGMRWLKLGLLVGVVALLVWILIASRT